MTRYESCNAERQQTTTAAAAVHKYTDKIGIGAAEASTERDIHSTDSIRYILFHTPRLAILWKKKCKIAYISRTRNDNVINKIFKYKMTDASFYDRREISGQRRQTNNEKYIFFLFFFKYMVLDIGSAKCIGVRNK